MGTRRGQSSESAQVMDSSTMASDQYQSSHTGILSRAQKQELAWWQLLQQVGTDLASTCLQVLALSLVVKSLWREELGEKNLPPGCDSSFKW